jgi:hypothetical protein
MRNEPGPQRWHVHCAVSVCGQRRHDEGKGGEMQHSISSHIGTRFSYLLGLVGLIATLAPVSAQSNTQTITLGTIEKTGTSTDWDEFDATADSPQLDITTQQLGSIRPWIGFSQISSTAKRQLLHVPNVLPGHVYTFTIHPAYVTGDATYRATMVVGTGAIADGGQKSYSTPRYSASGNPWRITVVPDSSTFTLALSNNMPSGNNYLYFDALRLTIQPLPWGSTQALVAKVKSLDTPNGGTWASGMIVNSDGHYNWSDERPLLAWKTGGSRRSPAAPVRRRNGPTRLPGTPLAGLARALLWLRLARLLRPPAGSDAGLQLSSREIP